MAWQPYERGASIGTVGTEQGSIERDEEHTNGARITLERGGRVAPWAITCGVYGTGMLTEFYSTREQAEADFEEMMLGINDLFASIDRGEDVAAAASRFFERWVPS